MTKQAFIRLLRQYRELERRFQRDYTAPIISLAGLRVQHAQADEGMTEEAAIITTNAVLRSEFPGRFDVDDGLPF